MCECVSICVSHRSNVSFWLPNRRKKAAPKDRARKGCGSICNLLACFNAFKVHSVDWFIKNWHESVSIYSWRPQKWMALHLNAAKCSQFEDSCSAIVFCYLPSIPTTMNDEQRCQAMVCICVLTLLALFVIWSGDSRMALFMPFSLSISALRNGVDNSKDEHLQSAMNNL